MDQRGEDLEERLLDFAARVGRVVDALPNIPSVLSPVERNRHLGIRGSRDAQAPNGTSLNRVTKLAHRHQVGPQFDQGVEVCVDSLEVSVLGKPVGWSGGLSPR